MFKTDLWESIERERRAIEYIEYCAIRRLEKRVAMFIVVGSLCFLLLAIIKFFV